MALNEAARARCGRFYHPDTLPNQYVAWITATADMDMRLIRACRLLREGEATIGEPYAGDFMQSFCHDNGIDPSLGDPARGRMCCSHWHPPHTCVSNLVHKARSSARIVVPCYLALHSLPKLLFLRKTAQAPLSAARKILTNTFWSSSFLVTFIVSVWAAICSVRKARKLVLGLTKCPPEELDKWYDPVETWGKHPMRACGAPL